MPGKSTGVAQKIKELQETGHGFNRLSSSGPCRSHSIYIKSLIVSTWLFIWVSLKMITSTQLHKLRSSNINRRKVVPRSHLTVLQKNPDLLRLLALPLEPIIVSGWGVMFGTKRRWLTAPLGCRQCGDRLPTGVLWLKRGRWKSNTGRQKPDSDPSLVCLFSHK